MTKPEHPIERRHESDLDKELRRERAARADLEAKFFKLQQQLDAEQAKLARVTSRTSVRFALRLAALARPVVRLLRRTRRAVDPQSTPSHQAGVTATIRGHRNEPGPESGPLVTIVVLNRDGARHLSTLLPALRDNTTYRSFEVVAVDNGSTDESVDLLNMDWGFPIQITRNSGNVSFSHGCNQGISRARGPYVLLLNNDITPINPGWLGALVNSLEEDPDRGAAGALLVYPERPGYVSKDRNTGADLTIQHRGIRYRWRRNAEPSATVPWAYNMGVGEDPTRAALAATVEVPAATAACLLVRRDLLDRLEGLDEAFMYGMEDVDLSLRVRTAGYAVVVVGAAALYHHEFGTQSAIAAARKRSNGIANLQHFSRKWGPKLSRLLQLESLLPEAQSLRHRPPPVVAVTVARDTPGLGDGWNRAHQLGEALASSGYSVVYADSDQDGWYELDSDVVTIISLHVGYDVRKAPVDATTIAWIPDCADDWIAQPWFDRYDICVPGAKSVAAALAAAGVAATEVVSPDADRMEQITEVARNFTLRPRIALKVESTGSDGATNDANERLGTDLAHELCRQGAVAAAHDLIDWETPAAQCVDVAIHIRGLGACSPNPAHLNILWITDQVDPIPANTCTGYDLVLVNSVSQAEALRLESAIPVEVAGQSTGGTDMVQHLATRLMDLVDELGWEPRSKLEDC